MKMRETMVTATPPATATRGRRVVVERKKATAKDTGHTGAHVECGNTQVSKHGTNVHDVYLGDPELDVLPSITLSGCHPKVRPPITRAASTNIATARAESTAATVALDQRMRLRDIGRAMAYRRLPQLASPATDWPAKRDTARGRKNFIVLDNAMIGTLNPEVRANHQERKVTDELGLARTRCDQGHRQDDRECGHDAEGCVGQRPPELLVPLDGDQRSADPDTGASFGSAANRSR